MGCYKTTTSVDTKTNMQLNGFVFPFDSLFAINIIDFIV